VPRLRFRLPGDRQPSSEAGPNIATSTGGGRASGVAVSLSLDHVARQADIHVVMEDAATRKWMARSFVWTLIGTNGLTLLGLGVLVYLDQRNIAQSIIAPADRIVNNQVIITLLGATTVQVGAITAIIARYLFPGRSRDG
jgi:hypothetical protein